MSRGHNHLVIMAGGVGSRFWPMSTPERPKQFIDVLGVGRTFLQQTVDRFKGVVSPENVWVVTSQKYADIVRVQLPEVPVNQILLEPCRRNTAPCIAYVAWRIKAQDPKANMVVAPSDHIVMNGEEFRRVITSALTVTQSSDAIVTLGMNLHVPRRAMVTSRLTCHRRRYATKVCSVWTASRRSPTWPRRRIISATKSTSGTRAFSYGT